MSEPIGGVGCSTAGHGASNLKWTQDQSLSEQVAEWHALWQEGRQQYIPVPECTARNCLPHTECALPSSKLRSFAGHVILGWQS